MKTKRSLAWRLAAATLPEVLIAAAVASIVLGGLMIGSVALQRSFLASDQLSRAQADLLRVADYMARDIRNATSVDTTASGLVLLTLTTADYYNRQGTPNNTQDDTANDPVLGRDGVTYGSNPVTIRYLQSGTSVLREVTPADSSSASSTRIADHVDNLSVTFDEKGTAIVTTSTATRFSRRKPSVASPTISLIMTSMPRNPTP